MKEYYIRLIEIINKLKALPPQIYVIDAWDEGKTFTSVNSENGMVTFKQLNNHMVYEEIEEEFKCLSSSEQYEVLQSLYSKYCK